MHTHFGSATSALGAFLSIMVVGSLWRLGWLHAARSDRPFVRDLAGAALFQY